jgi:pilus assembly protein CpaC
MNKWVGVFIALVFFLVSAMDYALGTDVLDGAITDEVYIIIGELAAVSVDGLTQLSVANPDVADLVDYGDKEITLVGKGVGQTAVFVWDSRGKRVVMAYVFSQNLDLVKERLKKLLKSADIHEAVLGINEQEGKVIVSGDIPKHKKEQFDQVVEKFSDDIISMVKEEEIGDLIQIDMQITELSTTLSKSLGIEWSTGTQTTSGNNITTTSSGGFTPVYGEIFPTLDGSVEDYFKIGQFQRSSDSALLAKINALIAEGKAHILSRPKLVVKNGHEASFLVGGQIPVVTTTTSTTGSQENVQFKKYGISMSITPEIKKEKIDIALNVEVSDVDASNAVGNKTAYSTRSAQTQLYLDDGQIIVLAGLIKTYRSESIKKVPFLGDIPVVGMLFRSRSNPTSDLDQELVISLRPTIIDKNRSDLENDINGSSEMSPGRAEGAAAPQMDIISPLRDMPQGMEEYIRSLEQKIAQAVVFPLEAERYGWEGTVKLGLLILSDGTLATALVEQSSGHEIFDEYALNTVKNIAPYSTFPSGVDIKELSVTIPIVYSLKRN